MPARSRRRISNRSLLPLLTLLAALPAHAQVVPDANPHYLDYNGVTTPLIGMSSEYLPHVTRPAKQSTLCTLESYASCLNNLHSKGLNTMQLLVSPNSSVGLLDCNTANARNQPPGPSPVAVPYDNEQPFFWNGSKWRLDRYESPFWTNLNKVLTDAGNLGIVVEVTLFDPWGGVSGTSIPTSPWSSSNNVVLTQPASCGTSAGFTALRYLASFDNPANPTHPSDTQPANVCARTQQMAFIQFAAQQLNGHTNFYWNLANEVDLVPTGNVAPDPVAQINWLNWAAGVIAGVEGSPSYPQTHQIAVNLTNQLTLMRASSLAANIKIVSGHYVLFGASGSVAAIPLVKANFNATNAGLAPFAFGFNEGRSTTCPNFVGARAEAWEFLADEGAVYDNYNLAWNDPNTGTVQSWLANLKSFLAPLSLTTFNGPQTASAPAWAPDLPSYGSADATGTKFYWGAMQATRNQYALYMHHSTILMPMGVNGFRYAPPASCQSFQTPMSLSLGSTAGHFKAEWIFPSTGAVACAQDVNWTPGTLVPVTSPHYNYDMALRLTRCTGSGACAPVQSCAATLADGCPPADLACPTAVAPRCPTPGVLGSCPNGNPPCDTKKT
jgi:hypothetical protein